MEWLTKISHWWKRFVRRWPETWLFSRVVHKRAWNSTYRSTTLWAILAPVPLGVVVVVLLLLMGRIQGASDLRWEVFATIVACVIVSIIVYVIGLVREPVRMQLEQRKF